MAGFKLRTYTTVKGSSIVEVVIAMVIIVVIFGIAMTIFTNVIQSAPGVTTTRAQAILDDLVQNAEQGAVPAGEVLKIDSEINVMVKIMPDERSINLQQVHFYAYGHGGKKITEAHIIINKPRNE